MNARDDDEPYDRDDDRAYRRRARRDVLDIGHNDGPSRRARTSARDLDEDRRSTGDRDLEDAGPRRYARDEPRRRNGDRDDDGRRRPPRPAADDDKPKPEGKDPEIKQKGQNGDDEHDAQQKEAQGRRKSRRPVVIAVAVIVALLLAVAGFYYWLTRRNLVDTDDAYLDGRAVSIAPQVAGRVISLDVTDNQFVRRGDPLIHIDPRQFAYDRDQAKGALDTAKAQLASQKLGVEISKKNFPAALLSAQGALTSARANLLLQESNYTRQKGLPKQATTQQDVDSATANFQQAEAQVQEAQARVTQSEPVEQNIGQSEQQVGQLTGQGEQAQARLDQAELNVEWSVVRAPQDGWVTRRNVEMGNYVAAGQQIMAIVSPDVWVTANFKETELNGMRPGQPVKIAVDAYPELDLRGHVDSVQHGSGSKFSAFPAENATGNFVKIVQRVPVKIVIDSGLDPNAPLPLGVSVVPTVTLR